ncbi:MAG TPA: c-type cytochrome [Chloroflexota bacterium]|nr:c-type cytochrome [Chloroflexota bacterium]
MTPSPQDRKRALQWRWGLRAVLVISAALVCACGGRSQQSTAAPRVDSERAESIIQHYGCTACHAIPGVSGGSGMTGPSLEGFGRRETIAGVVPNTPDNLAQWLEHPAAMKPGTAMPVLGVSQHDARVIAAYLSSLN